jgi:2-iminobutanoate/2-iminopropanoate deaminase
LIEGTIAEKTAQCCKNLKAIVEASGSSIEKVVRVGVFLTDMKVCEDQVENWRQGRKLTPMQNFAEMNGEYEKWFKHKPARSCVAVYQLPKGVPVEIEAIAIQ